jgi:hypothetical protein
VSRQKRSQRAQPPKNKGFLAPANLIAPLEIPPTDYGAEAIITPHAEAARFNASVNLTMNLTDSHTMVNGFMNSLEYRARFGLP